jgi:phenylpyruvate tautomerase PptA (4-oxalocrotonate tautomerase family)
MPFVKIALLKGKTPAQLKAIADGVHQALVDTYSVPPNDRFQVIEQYEADTFFYDRQYLDIERTDDVVFIHILASRWRDTPMKQALYHAIAQRLSADCGMRAQDIQVFISNNDRQDWSFGNGVASYVEQTPAQ